MSATPAAARLTSPAAQVSSVATLRLGYNLGSAGTVTLSASVRSGRSSTTPRVSLVVGYQGVGILNIQGGAAVYTREGVIGEGGPASSGTATITGAGSFWSMTENLRVGDFSTGAVFIFQRWKSEQPQCHLGYSIGSRRQRHAFRASSVWSMTDLYTGYSGTARSPSLAVRRLPNRLSYLGMDGRKRRGVTLRPPVRERGGPRAACFSAT